MRITRQEIAELQKLEVSLLDKAVHQLQVQILHKAIQILCEQSKEIEATKYRPGKKLSLQDLAERLKHKKDEAAKKELMKLQKKVEPIDTFKTAGYMPCGNGTVRKGVT